MYVTIDGSVAFHAARILPQRWNGWACPLFDRDTARNLVDWINTQAARYPEAASAAWDGDDVILTDPNYPESPPERIVATDSGLYAIGAFSWTWMEVEPDPEPTPGPVSGDYCSFVPRRGEPYSLVEHFRCDEHADGTITDPVTGHTVQHAKPGALRGFDRSAS